MSRIRIPPVLRPEAGGQATVETEGSTVGDALEALVRTFPALNDKIFREGVVQPYLQVYIDGEDIKTLDGLSTRVPTDSTILLLPAIAGGASEETAVRTMTRRRLPHEARTHGGSKIGSWWTPELVAYALDRFHRQHLRTPTAQEFRAGLDDLPSLATIRRLYGNIGNMLRHHGYRVRSRGGQPGRLCGLERDAKGLFLPKSAPPQGSPAGKG